MKKKLILILTLIFFILLFFNKNIFQFILEKKISRWTKYNSNLILSKLNYFSGKIEIKNIQLENKEDFFNQNIFEASLVKINLDPKTYFNELVVLKRVFLQKPKFYFEIKNSTKGENIEIEDNLELIYKLSKNQEPKIYPKKNKDKNFIIFKLQIKEAVAFIKYQNTDENIKINLSDMSFSKVGNSGHSDKEFQHYKEVMKIILKDIYFKIPDKNLRKLIKEEYKLN